jgi:hypothetical protein
VFCVQNSLRQGDGLLCLLYNVTGPKWVKIWTCLFLGCTVDINFLNKNINIEQPH